MNEPREGGYNPYLRAKPGEPRCQVVEPFPHARAALRCEYRPHPGHSHAALDGSVLWLDVEASTFDEDE